MLSTVLGMDVRRPVTVRRVRPAWLPPANTVSAIGAGVWWDVVAIDGDLGARAAEQLRVTVGSRCGPIACEPRGPRPRWYFLTTVGTATVWSEIGTEAFGACCYIGLPGSLSPDLKTVHWVVPPDGSDHEPLVQPDRLQAAVQMARSIGGAK